MQSRTENSKRNLVFGLLGRIVSIVLPFFSRTIIIYTLGVEYNGLGSLFGSILTVLSLFELGIGSAIVYGMYKPVIENDIEKINAYLSFFKKCYLVIGSIVLSIGLIIMPFLKFLVKESYPSDINIYMLFFIYLFSSISSYFFFAYRASILSATQRTDVITKATTVAFIIKEISQIIVLLAFKSYLIYSLIIPATTILGNMIQYYTAKKMYPNIRPVGTLPVHEVKDVKERMVGLLFQKIGSIILSSVDTIVISAFLGLTVLGIFNNYHYIISCLISVFAIIPSAIIPSIGNSIHTESVEKNYENFRLFHFIYIWAITFCCACLLSLYQHFIIVWIGDEYLLEFGIVICLVVYFYTYKNTEICYLFREAAGQWNEWKYVSLIAAIVNLVTNILLVTRIGLYGILISTIICKLFIYLPFFSYPLFKSYFKSNEKYYQYVKYQIAYMAIAAVICFLTYSICTLLPPNGIPAFIGKIFLCIIVPNLLMVLAYHKTAEFKNLLQFMKRNILKRNTPTRVR